MIRNPAVTDTFRDFKDSLDHYLQLPSHGSTLWSAVSGSSWFSPFHKEVHPLAPLLCGESSINAEARACNVC